MNTDGAANHAVQSRISAGAPLVEEHTTFSVRIASNADDLWKAVRVRHAAYARHLPELAARLTTPEHRWAKAEHPLYGHFCRTFHPDIDVREMRRDLRRAAAGGVPA